MLVAVADAIGQCAAKSAGGLEIDAASLDSTHMHVLIRYSGRDIENTGQMACRPDDEGDSPINYAQRARLAQGEVVLLRVRASALGQHPEYI